MLVPAFRKTSPLKKTVVLILVLGTFGSFFLIDKVALFFPNLRHPPGEVAGIFLLDKFLNQNIPDSFPADAQISSPYQSITGDVAIAGNLDLGTGQMKSAYDNVYTNITNTSIYLVSTNPGIGLLDNTSGNTSGYIIYPSMTGALRFATAATTGSVADRVTFDSSGRIINPSGLYFYNSGNAGDGLPYARLTEAWGTRFTSPDNRWALSTAGSFYAGIQPDGVDRGSGNIFASGGIGLGRTDVTSAYKVLAGTADADYQYGLAIDRAAIRRWGLWIGGGGNGALYFRDISGNNNLLKLNLGTDAQFRYGAQWNQGIDLAEGIKADGDYQNYQGGDILSAGIGKSARKSSLPYDPQMIGGVSTRPSLLMNWGDLEKVEGDESLKDPGKIKLALSGRIPIKVTLASGAIISGIPITSSSLPGIGMKATKAGRILGWSLESTADWNTNRCPTVSSLEVINWPEDADGENSARPCFRLPDGTYIGKVMVFLNLSWYDPDTYLTSTAGFKLNLDQLRDVGNNLITRIGAFGKLIVGKIQAGIIETQVLIVGGVDILDRLNTLSQTVETQQKEIESLKREIQQLKAR